MLSIGFYCDQQHPMYQQAQNIAQELSASILHGIENNDLLCDFDCILAWHNNQYNTSEYFLSILDPSSDFKKHIYIDYVNNIISDKKLYEFKYNDPLPKAMGLSKLKDKNICILDGTAGMTIDSYGILRLSPNVKITLLENSKIISSLIKDALYRLKAANSELSDKISFKHDNFIDYLQGTQSGEYDIIYLDPMFVKSETIKSKPNKNMQFLQNICFNPNNIEELLDTALMYAKSKVVLKRSRSQPKIKEKLVNYSVESKQIRYDVYLT